MDQQSDTSDDDSNVSDEEWYSDLGSEVESVDEDSDVDRPRDPPTLLTRTTSMEPESDDSSSDESEHHTMDTESDDEAATSDLSGSGQGGSGEGGSF